MDVIERRFFERIDPLLSDDDRADRLAFYEFIAAQEAGGRQFTDRELRIEWWEWHPEATELTTDEIEDAADAAIEAVRALRRKLAD